MIEIIITCGAIAAACIPAEIIGEVLGKRFRHKVREIRRQQAQEEQAEISALYNHLVLKQIQGGNNEKIFR